MKNRHKRFMLVVGGLAALGIAAALVFNAFNQNMVFFFSPSQVYANEAPKERTFRLGGLVEQGTLKREDDGLTVHFVVTDTVRKMNVTYKGILPDLFREGKGVIAQGRLNESGMFYADEVLAKHDENYMPPEAARAIEKARAAAARGG
jgi:cytochrome c-type biogenesis protein CcmE